MPASLRSSSTCTPTVQTLPLRQMTGEAEFNEVFFTDTRIHESEMLGQFGDGWRVAHHADERAPVDRWLDSTARQRHHRQPDEGGGCAGVEEGRRHVTK